MHLLKISKKLPSISFPLLLHYNSSTVHRSYYEILGVSKTASPKLIKLEFLKKARLLHPDYNNSVQAQQQFKEVKQAYTILRDPHKRYLYDSGIGNESVSEHVYTGGTSGTQQRYYQNKWYEYKKSSYADQRDQYYQERQNYSWDDTAYQSKLVYRILGVGVLLCGFFGCDYLYYRKTPTDIEREHVKHIIEGDQTTKAEKRLTRYIDERSKINQA